MKAEPATVVYALHIVSMLKTEDLTTVMRANDLFARSVRTHF